MKKFILFTFFSSYLVALSFAQGEKENFFGTNWKEAALLDFLHLGKGNLMRSIDSLNASAGKQKNRVDTIFYTRSNSKITIYYKNRNVRKFVLIYENDTILSVALKRHNLYVMQNSVRPINYVFKGYYRLKRIKHTENEMVYFINLSQQKVRGAMKDSLSSDVLSDKQKTYYEKLFDSYKLW